MADFLGAHPLLVSIFYIFVTLGTPIIGDAQNDAGGRILRLVSPTERQAYDYDNDLRRFQADAKNRYAAWTASLDPH